MRRSILLLLVPLLACHSKPSQPIPVVGASNDVARMAGEWDGFYESDDGTRGGSIDFHLKAGSDSAVGDVLMIPRDWGQPVEAWERAEVTSADAPSARTLTIRFVRVEGDSVSGRMTPFRDPTCGCRVVSSFAGKIRGGKMQGRYESLHEETGRVIRGRWEATRKTK